MLEDLKAYLNGKVVILGIGNTLRSDDGVGSILAGRIKDRVPYQVYDAGASPENYLEKVVKEKPDTIIIIDAVDFNGAAGEFRVQEAQDLKTANLFSTHNASISLLINYLQNDLPADIIILGIQPKNIALGDNLSPEINETLNKLENWWFDVAHQRK